MIRLIRAASAAVLWCLWPNIALAQERPITLEDALALARQRAPAILAAKAQIDEARGRLVGASVLLRRSPELEAAAGPRFAKGGTIADVDVGLRQTFELGGQRGARVAGAEADLARSVASSDNTTRRLLRDVAIAFYRALFARERARVAKAAEGVAVEVVRIAEKRQQAGDVAALDVNVARAAFGRAKSESRTATATLQATLGELRLLLGLESEAPLDVRGDLHDRGRFELKELAARAPDRPDLKALESEVRQSEAEVRLGQSQAWPDLGVGVHGGRLEGTPAVLATLTLTLPVFERGQGLRAEASARAKRQRLELDAGRRAVGVAVRTAYEVYASRVEAADELEREALPVLDENEALSRKSYEAGQIGLAEFLLIRREILETRNAYLDRLLDADIAGIELEASAGVLR